MTTGLDVFDTTVQKSNRWLLELMSELDTQDKHYAYLALRATLHALRDRLTVEEASQLSAQLPMLIRGLYYDAYDPSGKPLRERHKEDFLRRIDDAFYRSDPGVNSEEIAQAVFRLLSRRISEGEIEDVRMMMPKEIRDLWPEPSRTG
ncbi:MAG: DUF2267 domain-containing protein [SAR202 cluster bacterium]|nr:DUF2267 domain-containing protein [SAR202 cluster bacterium]